MVKLSRSALLGQGTFGMVEKKKENEAYVELDIRDASKIIRKLSEHSGGFVDLLHVNCEGCEWEMLDNIINNNLLPSIRLNSLTHYPTNIQALSSELYKLVLITSLRSKTSHQDIVTLKNI